MSVILFGENKFLRIYSTLLQYQVPHESTSCSILSGEIYRVFGLDPFKTSEYEYKHKIINFVSDLYRGNQIAYYKQYPDERRALSKLKIDDSNLPEPYPNLCAFLKSLHAVDYNLITNDGVRSEFASIKYLRPLIDVIEWAIIDSLPDYQNADWCD